jgi:carbon monoxide dehydrogenase subunit G
MKYFYSLFNIIKNKTKNESRENKRVDDTFSEVHVYPFQGEKSARMQFSISIKIQRPPEVVSRAFEKPENMVYWISYLERFEVISDPPGRVGSLARLHYVQKGRKYIMEDRMIHYEPGVRYVSEVTGDVITARVETALLPVDGGTEISMNWAGSGKKILKYLLPFLRKKMIREATAELEIFKRLVERYGADFSGAKGPRQS